MPHEHATRIQFTLNGKDNYFFWTIGKKFNPPILLLPGFTGTHSDLLHIGELLRNDYFVIIPDLPGWGLSSRHFEKLTIHNYAIFVKDILDQLNIDKATICGHCMGATVAIETAYQFSDRVTQLIVISTPYLDKTSHALFMHLADWYEHSPQLFRRIFFLWRSRIFGVPLSFFILQFRSFKKKIRVTIKNMKLQSKQDEDVVEENWISLTYYDYQKIKRLTLPVHFIHGEKDRLVNKNQAIILHAMLPASTLDIIPTAGHLPPAETPQSLAKLILKYN